MVRSRLHVGVTPLDPQAQVQAQAHPRRSWMPPQFAIYLVPEPLSGCCLPHSGVAALRQILHCKGTFG